MSPLGDKAGKFFQAVRKRVAGSNTPVQKFSSPVVSTVIDGIEVPDLARWMVSIRDYCKAGRDLFFGGSTYIQYIQDCQDWYEGRHWAEEVQTSTASHDQDDLIVENRIGEKVRLIASMMVEGRPAISVLPRTGGDIEKAAMLEQVLDLKLRNLGFPKFLASAMADAPKFGGVPYRCDRMFHRGEPDGQDVIEILDPLSIAWEPHCKTISDSKVLVHVELWDKQEAEAHFTSLLDIDIKGLPTSGTEFPDLSNWSLRYLTGQTGVDNGEIGDFLSKTVITTIYYMDSERIMVPKTEMRPVLGEQGAPVVDPETGEPAVEEVPMIDPDTADSDEPKQLMEYKPRYPSWRVFIMAGDDRVIYDGHLWQKHGKLPIGMLNFIPVSGRVVGEPLVAHVRDQQAAINTALTKISKQSELCGNPPVEILRRNLKNATQKITNEPGLMIDITEPMPTIRPVIYPSVNQAVIEEYNTAGDAFERIIGISNVSGGQARASDSGVKVAQLDDITSRKLGPYAIERDDMMQNISYMLLSNIAQFTDPREIQRIIVDEIDEQTGQPQPTIRSVDLGEIINDGTIDFDVVLVPVSGEMTPRERWFDRQSKNAQMGQAMPGSAAQFSDVPQQQQPNMAGLTTANASTIQNAV